MMSRATDASMKLARKCEPPLVARQLQATDAEALGLLLHDAYKGTVDDDGQTLEKAVQEVKETFFGRYGGMIWTASHVVLDENAIVCCSVVTNYQHNPLIAFAATLPAYQGKGLCTQVITESIRALARLGRPQVRLVVTEKNERALSLYQHLGFKPVDKK